MGIYLAPMIQDEEVVARLEAHSDSQGITVLFNTLGNVRIQNANITR